VPDRGVHAAPPPVAYPYRPTRFVALNRQIAELDAIRTIEAPAAGNLRTADAINAQAAALAAAAKLRAQDEERRQAKRTDLADKLTVEAKALADLKVEKAAVEGERRTFEADLGPVRYLAALIGADNETVLRWFILVVALLLDPAAVLLTPTALPTAPVDQDLKGQTSRARKGRCHLNDTVGRPNGADDRPVSLWYSALQSSEYRCLVIVCVATHEYQDQVPLIGNRSSLRTPSGGAVTGARRSLCSFGNSGADPPIATAHCVNSRAVSSDIERGNSKIHRGVSVIGLNSNFTPPTLSVPFATACSNGNLADPPVRST